MARNASFAIGLVCMVVFPCAPVAAQNQSVPASLVAPVDGTNAADFSQPLRWTSVPGVQAYYLYVGTAVGARDLVDTGETLQMSYLAPNLPADRTLYARMWTKAGGVWRYVDSSFSARSVLAARIAYPAEGTVGADLPRGIQWTQVANVETYYLYVGSVPGGKDLINSGETPRTSWAAGGLPVGQTLFARMWTRAGGVWRYVDSTFSAAPSTPVTATLTYPADHAANIDTSLPIQWTAISNAQAYYLYVGTAPGAKDLIDTGETLKLSYSPPNLPVGQTLYARLWTKYGGLWRYVDSTFTAAPTTPKTATLLYPADYTANAEMSSPIRWTAIANVQAYYLYIGTTVGAKDLIDSGETLQTSYVAGNLPTGRALYVRLWTKVAGVWRYVDSQFSAAPAVSLSAVLLFPANGAIGIDPMQPARWTAVDGAQAYYLYVGTTPGAKDVVDSYETGETTFPINRVPAGLALYARLWTRKDNVWRYRDSTFTASPIVPTFLNPTDGAIGVDAAVSFSWEPPASASTHQLIVGTTPGSSDVFSSGIIGSRQLDVSALPTDQVLYARVMSNVNGSWRHGDIAFSTGWPDLVSNDVSPKDGDTNFNSGRPFVWRATPLARAYRLTIGTSPGAADLHDSGEIHVNRRFVFDLPLGTWYGRISTAVGDQWYDRDFTFTVTANSRSNRQQISSALWATDFVRRMAGGDNRPFTWTELSALIAPRSFAVCSDYAEMLLEVLTEMNLSLSARRLSVALNPNTYDAHTLVELSNPDAQNWMLLDPTFDLTVRRAGTREWATAEDVSNATRTSQWSAVSYIFIGSQGSDYATRYYLDYPLLFVNIYHQGQPANNSNETILPYYQDLMLPISGAHQVYAVACLGSTSADLIIDGVRTQMACDGIDGLSRVFDASTILPAPGAEGTVRLLQPRRFVF